MEKIHLPTPQSQVVFAGVDGVTRTTPLHVEMLREGEAGGWM